MKKFLDVLDPRKSRSRVNVEAGDNSRILVAGASESFGLSQLSQALKAAGTIAAKSRTDVTVNFS